MAQRRTYQGKLQLQGGSSRPPGGNSRRYSKIRVGRQELYDVEVSQFFEKLLVDGEEIELTLNGVSAAPALFAMAGVFLYFTGEMSDINPLSIFGTIVFVVSLAYWFFSFINSGHRIYSVRIDGRLYRDDGVEYEATTPAPAESKRNNGLSHEVEKYINDLSHEAENVAATSDTAKMNESSVDFRQSEMSKLVCPQCGTMALVMPNTNIICGACKVWMRLED